jgi:hypothetical protein
MHGVARRVGVVRALRDIARQGVEVVTDPFGAEVLLCGEPGQAGEMFQLEAMLDALEGFLSGKGLARCLSLCSTRFQPLPIRTAREVFPQAAHPASFVERVMGPVGMAATFT